MLSGLETGELRQIQQEALLGPLCWLFKGGFKVSSGTVEWYRNMYGTDFDISEMASPALLGLIWGLCKNHGYEFCRNRSGIMVNTH